MPRVVHMEFRRGRPERFLLHLEDGTVVPFSPDTVLKYAIGLEKEFSSEEWEKIVEEDELRRAKEQALRYLEVRSHSRHELFLKLRKKGYRSQLARQALDQLAAVGLVDDTAFARQYIESELKRSPCSRMVLQLRLREKGIGREISEPLLEEAYSAISEETLARKVAQKFLHTHRTLPLARKKQRLIRHLQSRGFSWELIERLLAHLHEQLS